MSSCCDSTLLSSRLILPSAPSGVDTRVAVLVGVNVGAGSRVTDVLVGVGSSVAETLVELGVGVSVGVAVRGVFVGVGVFAGAVVARGVGVVDVLVTVGVLVPVGVRADVAVGEMLVGGVDLPQLSAPQHTATPFVRIPQIWALPVLMDVKVPDGGVD